MLTIVAHWEPRAEEPSELGDRLAGTLSDFEFITESLNSQWLSTEAESATDWLPRDSESLAAIFGALRDAPDAIVGDSFGPSLLTMPADGAERTRGVSMRVRGGGTLEMRRTVPNQVSIDFKDGWQDEEVRAFAPRVIESLAQRWSPAFVYAATHDDSFRVKATPTQHYPVVAPMTWVADRLGPFPTDVPQAKLREVDGGTLLTLQPEDEQGVPTAAVWDDIPLAKLVLDALVERGWNANIY